MTPRVWSLSDLIQTNLTDNPEHLGGTLHDAGWDLSVARLTALRDTGATPTRHELEALAWLGLPVQNTPEWLLAQRP